MAKSTQSTEYPPVNKYGVPLRSSLPPGKRPYYSSASAIPPVARQRETEDDSLLRTRMPVSQLRHRPIDEPLGQGTLIKQSDGSLVFLTNGKQIIMQRGIPQDYYTNVPRRQQPAPTFDDEEDVPIKAGDAEAHLQPVQRSKKRRLSGGHWLLFIGIGMLAMLALWTALISAISWYNTTMDDIHFGRPRTFQFDAVVHHNNDSLFTPTHFIVLNLNRHIEVIEQPAGDPGHMQVYIAATLIEDGSEFFPVTAYIKDVNRDGLPDIVLTVKGAHFVLINTGTGFRLAKQGDQIDL